MIDISDLFDISDRNDRLLLVDDINDISYSINF